jgi:uncharacterized phosphosugar-binding protein
VEQAARVEGDQVSARAYLRAAKKVLDHVVTDSEASVTAAAEIIVDSLRNNGIVQAFGTGHSEGLAMEIAGRAGGLVPTNKIALRDLVVFDGAPPQTLTDPKLEREPGIAKRLYEIAAPNPADVFVIGSNSGVNSSIVEMAQVVKEKGHVLIAVTSIRHSNQVDSRHPSGKRLADFADLVLDNGAPYGDALLGMSAGGSACAISSISGALLVQMMVAEVVRLTESAGVQAPIYLSANVPGGDEHNKVLEDRYAGRIRRSA